MSKQQLYINDVAVDMPAEEIKLKVESNIFSDVGSTMTAHSYSITLPRTMTNDSIFNNAYVPKAVTGGRSTHKYLKAALYIDGVPLFNDGQCVLTGVEEKGYKCNLFWGLLSIFDVVKEEGLQLCDLPMSKRWDEATMAGTWVQLTKYFGNLHNVTGMNDNIYNTLDSDSKALADKLPWSMPDISATSIINKICQVYGLQLEMSRDTEERIGRIYHPLVTRKAMCKDETMKIRLGCVVLNPSTNAYVPQIYKPQYDDNTHQYIYNSWQDLVLGYAQATSQPLANDALYFDGTGAAMVVKARSKCSIKSIRVRGKCSKYFEAVCGLEEDPSLVVQEAHNDGQYYTIDYTWENLSCEKGDVPIGVAAGSGAYWTSVPQVFNLHFDFEVEKIEDLENGTWWNWVRNYPEVTVIDYLNDILAHIGGCIVGSVNKRDTLRIMTYDEIFASQAQTFDTQGVKTITMTFDKLAQKNKYLHKDNEDTGINYIGEGEIVTEDTTLATERKAFESKFKVPRLALMRLWEVEKNENASNYKAKWVAKGDYICGKTWDEGYENVMLINTGQDFGWTLSHYYIDYAKVMRVPKVITATVRLSVLDLIKLDMGAPVYINQLNSFYLIKTLESESGYNYKLTLVQI